MEGHKGEPETINIWDLMVDLHESEDEDGAIVPARMRSPVFVSSNGAISSNEGLLRYSEAESPIFEPSEQKVGTQQYVSTLQTSSHHQLRSVVYVPHDPTFDEPPASSSVLFGDELNISSFENLVDDLQRSLSLRFSLKNEERKGVQCGKGDSSLHDKEKRTPFGDTAASRLSNESVTTTSSSTTSSSSPTGFKKWFRANYHNLKQKNHLKVGFKSLFRESHSKKLMLHQQETSRLSTGSSESGSDLEGNRNSTDLYNRERPLARASMDVTETESFSRDWHSFSHGSNWNKQSSQGSGNKARSWELGNGVTESSTKVALYCTSISTDVNAYEDCIAVKAILSSLAGTSFEVRSISEHPDYELELKNALNVPTVVVPSLCVAGKYFMGIDNIMQVYKKGILGSLLLEVLRHDLNPEALCTCRAGKFLICPLCKGKCKLTRKGQQPVTCRHCSGTGLLKCPNCLYS